MNKKEKKAGIILTISAIIFIVIFLLIAKLVDLNSKNGIIVILSFFIYLALALWVGSFLNKTTNKFLKILIYIFSFPLSFFFLILQFGAPFISVLMHLIFYIVISAVPALLVIIGLREFGLSDISYEKRLFLLLTITTIVSVAFNKYILKIILKFSPIIINKPEQGDTVEIIKLTKYIFSLGNIRFMIYFLYFVFLFFFSLAYLDDDIVFKNKQVDYAILQAFLVFLAFDNVIINSKNIKLLPSIILKMMWNIFEYDAVEEMKKRNENEKNED